MVNEKSKAEPNLLTLEASFALSLRIIKELAEENGDSPRAVARYLIQYLGGKRAFGSRRLTDIDLQSGGWADLTTDCDEYKELERCLLKKLQDMYLPILIKGFKFEKGRKPGTGGPIRKAIAKLLAKNPALKNPELWKAIEVKPPIGWKVNCPKYFAALVPTIEGPNTETDHMTYRRFCTVCGEERKKVKAKITG